MPSHPPSRRRALALVAFPLALAACGAGGRAGDGTSTLPTLPVSVADPTTTVAPATTAAPATSPPRTAPVGPPGTLAPLVDAGTTTTAGSGPVRYVAEPATGALRLGHRGTRVQALQAQLGALGYGVSADGYFGRGTEAAVRSFQQAQALNADGIAGPATLARLAQLATAST